MTDTMDETFQQKSEITVADAINIVQKAIDEYGRPQWLGMVPSSIRRMVPYPMLEQMMNAGVRNNMKRTEKYGNILVWAQDNLFLEVTPQTIMEVGDISYPTALKFISDHPDVFRKVQRGVYEIRDPKADRNR